MLGLVDMAVHHPGTLTYKEAKLLMSGFRDPEKLFFEVRTSSKRRRYHREDESSQIGSLDSPEKALQR